MALPAGTRLGPYAIVSELGAGGMGEVYRARDSRLNRDVAIKVLPISQHDDPALRARFEREAQALAALNHPNIATLYDVIDVADHRAIVMELVAGSTLAQRIVSGAVPLGDAIAYGINIADALGAAHAAGIVHRDLKPGNVIITDSGSVKVLDFGIAKRRVMDAAVAAETTVASLTEERAVIGTPAYMSPEQAHGRVVDARSDIFSLGVVLYEAITGRAPFQGDTAAALVSAILRDAPAPLRAIVPTTPRAIERCVMRCLEKDPGRRYQNAADLKVSLEDVREDLASPAPGLASPTFQRTSIARRVLRPIVYALAGVGIGVAGFLAIARGSSEIVAPRYRPFITEVSATNPSWSPDGRTLAYMALVNGQQQVFLRRIDSTESTQLTKEPASVQPPFWAPDGSRIYFVRARDCNLVSVSAGGGAPTLVSGTVETNESQLPGNSCRGSISPDGRTLIFARGAVGSVQLWSLETSTGKARMLNPAGMPRALAVVQGLAFSPDGRKLAVLASTTALNQSRGIWLIAWPDASARLLFGEAGYVASDSAISWMPDSRRVVMSGSPVDGGAPRLLVADTVALTLSPLTGGKDAETSPNVSHDGSRIAFVAPNQGWDLIQFPIDGGPPETVLATSRTESYPDVSASGLLAYVTDADGASAARLRSPSDRSSREIVGGRELEGDIREVRLSPDGQRVAVGTYAAEHRIWIYPTAGGTRVRLDAESTDQHGPSWSPDGNWIAYRRMVNGSWSIVKRPLGGGEPVRLDEASPGGGATDWSPSGEWIAHCRPDGIHLVSPNGAPTRVLTGLQTCAFRFSHDGSTLFGVRRDEHRRWELASWDVATARELKVVKLPISSATELAWLAVTPDNSRIIVTAGTTTSDIWFLEQFDRPPSFWTRWMGQR